MNRKKLNFPTKKFLVFIVFQKFRFLYISKKDLNNDERHNLHFSISLNLLKLLNPELI